MTRQTENIPISDIFRKYQSQLKSFISKRVPSKEDCEDILQNVFYQLLKTDSEGTVIGQVSAWFYSVARNQIIDRSRKHTEEPMPYKQGEDSEGRFMNEISEWLMDEDQSPEMDFIRSLVWEELENALAELPDEQRTVFELTELEGFSFKEISEATDVPVNTLLSRKRYAVLHLRKWLNDLYIELVGD